MTTIFISRESISDSFTVGQYEAKLDGYRGVAVISKGDVRLWSRNERDLGKRFPRIAEALRSIRTKGAVIDGELVLVDEQGKPSFQGLQYFDPKDAGQLCFYAFDLLNLDGADVMALTLTERRAALSDLLVGTSPQIRFSSTLESTPDVLVPIIREQGLEGIVAKDVRSTYEPGKRTGKWQKFKVNQEEEFLIGGYIPHGKGVESIVLGKVEENQLRYVACLDTRLPPSASRAAAEKLNALKVKRCPFSEIPARDKGNSWSGGMTEEELKAAIWVQPKYTAEVSFLEWTRGGFLRHAQVKRVLT